MANQISLHPGEPAPNSAMKGCDAMLPTLTDTLGSSVPGIQDPALTMIERCAAGTGHVNAGTTTGKAIATAGTPGELSEARAETAMRLMLMTGRKLSGKTLGIVGFGRSGRETARRAHLGFGVKIVVHNRSAVPDSDLEQFDAEQVDDIDRLLGRSDFVSLHCPASAENHHLIDALRLNRMKSDAHLINTAGRELVDEEALADALWYDTIAGAGLDDTHNNSAICDRIRGCENVVLLPNANGCLQPARTAM